MKQSLSLIGWKVAIVAVLPISLAGCMESVDTGDYEVILDQPDSSVEAGSTIPVVADTGSNTDADAQLAEVAAPIKSNSDTDGPSDSTVSSTQTDPEPTIAQATSQSDAGGSSETPVSTPTPSEQTEPAPEKAKPGVTAETKASNDSEANEKPKSKEPRIVKLLVPNQTFKTEGPEDALRVSFDDFDLLKVLNMEPVTEDAPSLMPKWLKELDGKRIRLRGFMFPPFEETGIRAFTLARDNQICCFGRDPLVYDLVDVFLRKDKPTDYIQNRPFDVVGVFHIGDSIAPGQLYTMDDAVVIDR